MTRRTMRAARLHAWGDVRVEEVALPEPGPGELLVRVEACGVCGSDALIWYVESKADAGPVVLGHEPAGTVERVGSGVAEFRRGDRVFVHHHAPCLDCAECRRGLWSSCQTWRDNALDPGGFAEFVRVKAHAVERDTLRIPDGMTLETAVFIEPLATAVRALRTKGRMAEGDVVLVIGLGSMGLLMTQLARADGAARVIGSDFDAHRRRLATELGADTVHDPSAETAAAVVRRDSARGADVIIVCPGSAEAVNAGLAAAAPGGRVVCFTPCEPGRTLEIEPSPLYFREVELLQSYSCGPDETRASLRLLEEGGVRTAPLITHRSGLDGVGAALQRAAGKGADRGDVIKTIIWPHGTEAAKGVSDDPRGRA